MDANSTEEVIDAASADPLTMLGAAPPDPLTVPTESSEHYRNVAIITKIVGLLSAMGSSYIIYSLVFDVKSADHRRQKLNRTFDRLLLGLCVADCISSIAFFLGSWMIPAEPPTGYEDIWNVMYPHASGTIGTCAAQGFFVTIGWMSGWLLTSSIAISFLLQVRYKFPEQRMRVAEYFFFGISVLYPIVGSVCIFVDKGFNPHVLGYCTISPQVSIDGVVTRGKRSSLYLLVFGLSPVFLTLVVIPVCMGMLFCFVRRQESRAARYSIAGTGAASTGRRQKRVFIKSMLYMGAGLPACIICLIISLDSFGVIQVNYRILSYVTVSILPLQGVLNVLIYSNFFNAFKEGTASLVESVRGLRTSYFGSKRLLQGSSSNINQQQHASGTAASPTPTTTVSSVMPSSLTQPSFKPGLVDTTSLGTTSLGPSSKSLKQVTFNSNEEEKEEIACSERGFSHVSTNTLSLGKSKNDNNTTSKESV